MALIEGRGLRKAFKTPLPWTASISVSNKGGS